MYQEFEEEKSYNLVFYVLVIFTGVFFAWMYLTSLDSRVKGMGTVVPFLNKQIIEATNSGAVVKIYKKDGATLKKDDPILLIDPTTFKAEKKQVKGELAALEMKLLRYTTESDSRFLRFSSLPKGARNKSNKKYFDSENTTFKLNQNLIKQKIKSAKNKIILKQKEIGELKAKERKLRRQINIVSKKVNMITPLVRAKAYSKVDLLDLKSKLVDYRGELDVTSQSLKKINADIRLLNSNKDEIIKNYNATASGKRSDIGSKLEKLKEQLVIEDSKVTTTLIKSPVEGYLNRMYVTNLNDMVRAGDMIAEVIPTDSPLFISTKVAPKDIAFLKKGQSATVKLTSYDYNIYGFLRGKITDISLDVFMDKGSKESYYLVKISTDKSYLKYKDKKLKIIPGMVADVDILVGKRTLLEYVFLPILKVLHGAGHEI